MKKMLKNGINVNQKWILPSVSFIERPNIFGNQNVIAPKTPNSVAPKRT